MAVRNKQAGFTLIELVVASAIAALVLLLTSMALRLSLFSFETTSIQADLESSASTIVDFMSKELKDGGTKYSNFAIGTTQQSITFARCTGYAAGKCTFGNQITYALVTYNGNTCLERTEIVGAEVQKRILSDKLLGTAVTVKTPLGTNVNVTGINFQMLSADVVTITVAVQKSNFMLKENVTAVDDVMVVTSQSSVQMLND
jgi:prepilin-type N-terminal cleavage/methylation domain-containing protein